MTDDSNLPISPTSRTTMIGGGGYDEGARHQRTAVAHALPLLVRAAETAPIPDDGSPFVLVDYGSATGFNTFAPAREVLSAVRRRGGTSVPVCVVHNDQAGNDFGALFQLVATSAESYVRDAKVFPLAVGRSFYGAVVPAGFASLGWSANAVHWLSAAPHRVANGLTFRRPDAGSDTAFARRAHEDWTTFLRERAAELRPGGELVIVLVEADEAGSCGADHFLDVLTQVLVDAVGAGTLRREEVARMVVPLYFRTEREVCLPFTSKELDGRLALVEHEHAVLDDPLWAAFERTGDKAAFALAHVAWLRGYSENVLFSVLDADRGAERRIAIADCVYDEVRARVQARPSDSRCSWRLGLLRITRC
jgi:salicylate 1-O-methyltransferase